MKQLALYAVSVLFAAGTVLPTSVHAQGSSLALEEVIVTATKREQSLQDVAVSVTALSNRMFTRPVEPAEDHISSVKDDEWNRKILEVLGEGRLEPREVKLGDTFGEWVEVESGISEGERVVRSGAFLIAAESRIRDLDLAQATAEGARTSILSSAATAVLAQANAQPELALRLLV